MCQKEFGCQKIQPNLASSKNHTYWMSRFEYEVVPGLGSYAEFGIFKENQNSL